MITCSTSSYTTYMHTCTHKNLCTHTHTSHTQTHHTHTHTHARAHTHHYHHQYLQGQFYQHRVYREGYHWERLWKLGCGGQATCFGIADRHSNSLLALKEVGWDQAGLRKKEIHKNLRPSWKLNLEISKQGYLPLSHCILASFPGSYAPEREH